MTHDTILRYYYYDLNFIPRLTDEEQQLLIATVPFARAQHLSQAERQAKQRLVEGHLGLAHRIVVDECPSLRIYLRPDLVQEASLALIEATRCYTYTGEKGDFTAYAATVVHKRVKRIIGRDALITFPSYAWTVARKQDRLEEARALQHPLSLDRLLDEDGQDEGRPQSLLATLTAPSCSLQTTSPAEDTKRALVERLLSYLSPHAQAVLRLRYGLLEGDERPHSINEIARALGTTYNAVRGTELDALRRLRGLAAGEARLVKHNGRQCISLRAEKPPSTLAQERQKMLLRAYHELEAQGVPRITVDRLVALTHIPEKPVRAFLRAQRDVLPTVEHRQARAERLREAYEQLVAAGKTPTPDVLRLRAHTSRKAALQFLQMCRQQQQEGKSATSLAGV